MFVLPAITLCFSGGRLRDSAVGCPLQALVLRFFMLTSEKNSARIMCCGYFFTETVQIHQNRCRVAPHEYIFHKTMTQKQYSQNHMAKLSRNPKPACYVLQQMKTSNLPCYKIRNYLFKFLKTYTRSSLCNANLR